MKTYIEKDFPSRSMRYVVETNEWEIPALSHEVHRKVVQGLADIIIKDMVDNGALEGGIDSNKVLDAVQETVIESIKDKIVKALLGPEKV